MRMSKAVQRYVDNAKEKVSYWLEGSKLDFSLSLERQRRRSNLSYGDLAAKLGTSPAYVSKVFRGDANLTIESMVKLTRAVGGKLHLEITDESDTLHWIKAVKGYVDDPAANGERWKKAAEFAPVTHEKIYA